MDLNIEIFLCNLNYYGGMCGMIKVHVIHACIKYQVCCMKLSNKHLKGKRDASNFIQYDNRNGNF